MKSKVYAIGFWIVAISVLIHFLGIALQWFRISNPFYGFSELARAFGEIVPVMIRNRFPLPSFISIILNLCFVALVIRRIRIRTNLKTITPPSSFTLFPYVLMCVALVSIALLPIGLLLAVIWGAGAGIVGVLAIIPATFILAPLVAWIEVRSLKLAN